MMMRYQLPLALPGQSIGLLGGSFDPAHNGHVQITLEAMKRCGLDQVWWLVTPGNPLKPDASANLAARIAAAREIMDHPRVKVTGIEAMIGTRYTADTLAELARLYRGVRLVWIMGADNLAGLHSWDRWQDIALGVPMAVMARPGHRMRARTSRAARMVEHARLPAGHARLLKTARGPSWSMINMPMCSISSTQLRNLSQVGGEGLDRP